MSTFTSQPQVTEMTEYLTGDTLFARLEANGFSNDVGWGIASQFGRSLISGFG